MKSVSLLVTSGWCDDVGNFFIPCPTKVINFDRQTKICDSLPNYPEDKTYGAVGGLIGHDAYVSCGGTQYDGTASPPFSDKCYKFGSTTPIVTMRTKRRNAASVVMTNKLWVIGGEDENKKELKSTEFVDPAAGSAQFGPDLPKRSFAPCLILVNSSTALLIGGYPDPQDKTWI